MALFASNGVAFGSNLAVTSSNFLYPGLSNTSNMALFASNTAVAASNRAYVSWSNNSANVFLGTSSNVGIGTSSPGEVLHVVGKSFASTQVLGSSNSASNNPTFSFRESSNSGMYMPSAATIAFVTNSNERMRITSNGFVGIGKTPTVFYDINGDTCVSGNLYFFSSNIATQVYNTYPPPASASAFTTSNVTVSGQLYGNGLYTMSVTSQIDAFQNSWQVFDASMTSRWQTGARYQTGTGNYIGSSNTLASGSNIAGEWLQVSLPISVSLSNMRMLYNSNSVDIRYSPRDFALVGSSNSGSNWDLLMSQTNYTGWTYTATASNQANSFAISNSNAYNTLRLVINKTSNYDYAIIHYLAFDGTTASSNASCISTVNNANEFLNNTLKGDLILRNTVGSNIHLGRGTSNPTMTLDSNANVGIGTTTPLAPLHVVGKLYSDTQLLGTSNDSTSTPSFSFREDSNTGIMHGGQGIISFVSQGDEKIRFDSNGRLGIGTLAPTYTLDVNGAARFTSGITACNSYINTSNEIGISPNAYNSLLIWDDQRPTTTFTGSIWGSATRYTDSNYIELTPNTLSQTGFIAWPINPGNSFSVSFDYYSGPGGTNGANGIYIAFYSSYSNANDTTTGYNLYFDEYNGGSGNDRVATTANGSIIDTWDLGVTQYLDNATWKRIDIQYIRGTINISIDATITRTIYDQERSFMWNTNTYFGIMGRTGGATNFHRIRNIRVSKISPGIWPQTQASNSSDIYYPYGNLGIGTYTPAYKLDVKGDINFIGTLRSNGVPFTSGGSSQWSNNSSNVFLLSSNVGIGTSNPIVKLTVSGTDSSTLAGPHANFYTNTDNFPLMQLLPYTHNSVNIGFDTYWSNNWFSSTSNGNFLLSKSSNLWSILCASNIAAGSSISAFTTAMSITSGGSIGLGTTNASNLLDVNGFIGTQGINCGGPIIASNMQFPPIPMTSNTLVYNNLTYTISSSFAGTAFQAFNSNTSNVWEPTNGGYSNGNGIWTNALSTVSTLVGASNYAGHWIQLGLPSNMIVDEMLLYPKGGGTFDPKDTYIVGSTDNSNFTLLNYFNGLLMTSNAYRSYIINSNYTPYRFYRLIAGSTTGSGNVALNDILFRIRGNLIVNLGNVGIGTSNLAYKFSLSGTDSNMTYGPHTAFYTSADAFPLMQIQAFSHNAMNIAFDTYASSNGTWLSSTSNGNFWMSKTANLFSILYTSNVAPSSNVGATSNALAVTSGGNIGLGITSPAYKLDVNGTMRGNGCKLGIMGSVDGSNARGIFLYDATNTDWGIYMATSNVNRSLAVGTTCGFGTVSSFAVRFRASNSSTNGFIFENASESCLLGIRASDGLTYIAGSVGIGTQTPSYTLHVIGSIYASGDIIGLSDKRFKTNINIIDSALAKLHQLNGYTYELKSDATNKRHTGLIAQEIKEVIPEVVYQDANDNTYSIAYGNMAGIFVEAIKEVDMKYQKHINFLRKQIKSLKKDVKQLQRNVS